MSGRHLLFAHILDDGYASLGLFKYIEKKWAVPEALQYFTANFSLCSNTESATGAISDTGFPEI